jgi:hypothetical protein
MVSNSSPYDLPLCDTLKPWRDKLPNAYPTEPSIWPRDFWGVPFPVNHLEYYRTNGRVIVPRDPATIMGYNPLGVDGWPFYPGDVVRIQIRQNTVVGHVNVVTGELVQLINPMLGSVGGTQYSKTTMMYSSTQGKADCPLYGTVVSRCKIENDYFDRFHLLVGEELLRFENIVKYKGKIMKPRDSTYSSWRLGSEISGTTNDRMVRERQEEKCTFMFHLVLGSNLGNELRSLRDIVLKEEGRGDDIVLPLDTDRD